MKRLFLTAAATVFCLLAALSSGAQTPQDSLAIAGADWQRKEVGKGMVVRTASLELFGSPQQVSLVEIDTRRHRIEVVYPGAKLVRTSEQGAQAGARAAVNAGFFNMKAGGAVDFLKVDGRVLAPGADRNFDHKGALMMKGRKMDIVPWDAEKEKAEKGKGRYKTVLVSRVVLMDEGKIADIADTKFATTRHPRSVFGIGAKGKAVFLVVDGRHKGQAAGMSLKEAAYLAKQLGLKEALNLDGGGSSALWVCTEGVVSYPSDNRKFDHEGERRVSSVIVAR